LERAAMRVIDRDTGKEVILDATPEFHADMDAFRRDECSHFESEIRDRIVSGGGIQAVRQCLHCGAPVGNPVKRSELTAKPASWDVNALTKYQTKRETRRTDIYQKHIRIQRNRTEGWWKEYNDYLRTDGWKRKRAKVLARAQNLCEGCREREATQVHHLTYRHRFDEFLFELVAVCDPCHTRLHNEDAEIEEPNDWREGMPCDGCRSNSERNNRRWCSATDTLAVDALAPDGECGEDRKLFDPLK
jgi:hypothetical protein